jgi:hypothetical protein
MRRLLTALLILLTTPCIAYAQYYVCASNCPNGATPSDASSSCSAGTFAAPFATPQHAQAVMAACSTKKTIIEAGTYTLGANWTFTSSDNNTTYVAYQGATPIISGGGSAGANNFMMGLGSTTSGITFKGITFQNFGGNNGTNNITGFGGLVVKGSGHLFQYNTFLNCTDACLHFAAASSSTADSNRFTNVTGTTADFGHAIVGEAVVTNITISHNLCENLYYSCAAFDGVDGNASGIHDITYEANVIVNACQKGPSLGWDCGALYMSDRNGTSTNMFIKDNVVMGGFGSTLDGNNTSSCIYLDDEAHNVTATGNLCYGDSGDFGVHLHGNINAHFTNNVFVLPGGSVPAEVMYYQTGCCGSADKTTMSGNTFQNNVVVLLGNRPTNGPYEVNGTPTNMPTVSGNLYYMASGQSFKNPSSASIFDSSPIYCGPSTGVSPLGNISPQQLWTKLASGVVSSWTEIRTNQGPIFRSCAAGQF